MSLNKSEISLLTIDKKMSSSQNILKNKDRFTKTEQIDTRRSASVAPIINTTVATDITDIPLAFDLKLDKDVSDVPDVLIVKQSKQSKQTDIIDKSTIEILD